MANVFDIVSKILPETNKIQGVHDKLSNDIIPKMGDLSAIKQKIENLPADLKNKLTELFNGLPNLIPQPPSSPPPPPVPPPMDPVAALKGIADGIRTAEGILNEKNLIIASGYFEVDIQLKVGNEVGASAKIHVDINPKPYN